MNIKGGILSSILIRKNRLTFADMNCIVTAGPTYEPLDEVRRLTNFSTGKLGTLLANFLVEHGHDVTLLIGHYATYRGEQLAQTVQTFTTTADLKERLKTLGGKNVNAVFHAAAVSDFSFGNIYKRAVDGSESSVQAGKISTRDGTLFAELLPTPKIIRELPDFFPAAKIVGWKYEVDGNRATVLEKAAQQIAENKTDACVANGVAYGEGFGLLNRAGEHQHFADMQELFGALERI